MGDLLNDVSCLKGSFDIPSVVSNGTELGLVNIDPLHKAHSTIVKGVTRRSKGSVPAETKEAAIPQMRVNRMGIYKLVTHVITDGSFDMKYPVIVLTFLAVVFVGS